MRATRSSSLTTTAEEMTLTDLLDAYTAANECSPRYRESLKRTVRKLQDSGLTLIGQLTPDRINNFLASLPLGPTTRHNIRRELLTLWKFAYEEAMTDVYPARVRRIRAEYKPVRAWTPLQLEKMLEAAEKDVTPISRRVPHIRRCDVIPVWARLNYETGVRFEDMLLLQGSDFANGCLMLNEHKTRKPLVRVLSDEAIAGVSRLIALSPDGTLFRWFLCRRRAFYLWRDFLDANGFGGSTKWFRRAAATQVHKQRRGAAKEFLQHSADHLQYRHYIDQSQIDDHITPPQLGRRPK